METTLWQVCYLKKGYNKDTKPPSNIKQISINGLDTLKLSQILFLRKSYKEHKDQLVEKSAENCQEKKHKL